MKKRSLSVALLSLVCGSAVAADLPARKADAVMPPLPQMWGGFYAGLNAGYGWGTNGPTASSLLNAGSWSVTTTTVTLPPQTGVFGNAFLGIASSANPAPLTQSGFIGGGQIGYNLQFNDAFVGGFEADLQGATFRSGSANYGVLNGASNFSVTPDAGVFGVQNGSYLNSVSSGLDYLGTARGRIGYLIRPNLLVYGTGGLAYGNAWANVGVNGVSTLTPYAYATGQPTAPYPAPAQSYVGGGKSNNLLVGYSAGGGVEWMILQNWSLKAEALYYNLGNLNVSTAAIASPAYGQILDNPGVALSRAYYGPGVVAGQTTINYQGVIARAGVNYHFHLGAFAPVVAKY